MHIDRKFKSNWNTSTTVQLGFGQLEILVTPVLTKNSPKICNDKVELIVWFYTGQSQMYKALLNESIMQYIFNTV